MDGGEPVTRDEINRLWADLNALRMLVTMDVAARWDDARIEQWFDRLSMRIDQGAATSEAGRANWLRAVGELAAGLRSARPRPPTGPA